MHCVLNGTIVLESEARISAFDRGFLYADGVFETLRAYRGRPFLLDQHWHRLSGSARFLGIGVPAVDPGALVARLLEANGLADASVRVTVSRGVLPPGPRPGAGGAGTLLIHARPLRPGLQENSERGIEGAWVPWPLRARGLPLQGHKTLAYLASTVALGAVAEGVEPLLATTEGFVSETATANLFWVRGGRLFTPSLDCGALPGVTRAAVLALAQTLDLETEQGFYPPEHVEGADEAFVTNSVVELTPLVRLGDRNVGGGRPGPTTRTLQAAYREWVVRTLGTPP